MNIYEMYEENNYQFGYYVSRENWGGTIAKIIRIDGVIEGQKIPGRKPYYNSPKVWAYFYNVFPNPNPTKCNSSTFIECNEIRCPGNYSYRMYDISKFDMDDTINKL